jgi:hypothetical protein
VRGLTRAILVIDVVLFRLFQQGSWIAQLVVNLFLVPFVISSFWHSVEFGNKNSHASKFEVLSCMNVMQGLGVESYTCEPSMICVCYVVIKN